MNELTYKTETDPQTQIQTYGQQRGIGSGANQEFEIKIHTLLYIKHVAKKHIPYSIGDSAQCSTITYMGNNLKCKHMNHFIAPLKLTQHSKATVCAESLQSCPALCNSMDYSPSGSSVYGILQARLLERVCVPSSRGASRPRDRTWVSSVSCTGRRVLYHQCHLEHDVVKQLYPNIK